MNLLEPGRGFQLQIDRGSRDTSFEAGVRRRSMPTMGTLANISVCDVSPERAFEAIEAAFAEIARVARLMSTHDETSQISRVNDRSGSDMLVVDPRVIETARASLEWSRLTDGRFDATTLPLLHAWGFRDPDSYVSDPDVIEEARSLVDWRGVAIEEDRLGLSRAGQGLDFGGIGKGYAVDRAVAVLRDRFGIERALVEIGGDLYALGRPPDRAGWRVGLQNPLGPGFVAVFELADMAVATSGNYGVRHSSADPTWGDTFDPSGGRPTCRALSTSVIAPTATDADAAATVLFLNGGAPTGAMRLERGVASLHVRGERALDPESLVFDASDGFPPIERVTP